METTSIANPQTLTTENPQTTSYYVQHNSQNQQNALENQIPRSGEKRKRPISDIWKHFCKIELLNGEICKNFSTCLYCKEKVPSHSRKNGTSSLWNHSRGCKLSPLHVQEDSKQKTINKDNVTGAANIFCQKKADEKCFEMIVRDELSLRFVEGGGFKSFLLELQPKYKVPGRKTVAKGILARYQLEKAKLMSLFGSNKNKISLTTDCWTSIQNINYLVLTAHFLDSEFKLHKRIINFCVITSHKGDDIGRLVDSCLRQWGITNIFAITVDNATTNDVVVAYLKKRLRSYKTLMFGGEFLHCRCVCHILNLIVKDGIKELEGEIQKIWNCVKYIRSSPQRLAKFREYSVLENLRANANIPLDVVTRWNSTFLMLEAAIKYENVFSRFSEEDQAFKAYFEETDRSGRKREGPPEDMDWRNAEAFVLFLKKFYDATIKLSAWKTITANIVFGEIMELQCEIDSKMSSNDAIMQKVAMSMKTKFNKYWGGFEGMNKIVIIANILDPRYKMKCVTIGLCELGFSQDRIDQICHEVKEILFKMYEEYKGSSEISVQNSSVDLEQNMPMFNGKSRIMRAIMQERMGDQSHSISNEVEQYFSDKYVGLHVQEFDIAVWWRQNVNTYPVLSKLAKAVLAIPCSTVASENAFSLGMRVVDPFRASLTPNMVEALVCTSDWLKGEEVNFYKDPTEEELEFYTSIEEIEKEDGVVQSMERPVVPVSTIHSANNLAQSEMVLASAAH